MMKQTSKELNVDGGAQKFDTDLVEVFEAIESAQTEYEQAVHESTITYLASGGHTSHDPPRTDLPLALSNVQFT